MRFIERTRQAFMLFLLGFIALIIACVVLYFLVLKPTVMKSVSGTPGGGAALVPSSGPHDSYTDPNAGIVFLVPASRVPKTQAGRYASAADTLLADRWANNENADTEVGPNQDVASIPIPDRQAVIAAVSGFLRAWETFTPPDLASSATAENTYANSVAPWVAPADLIDITGRVDNSQGTGICPQAGCQVGSKYVAGDLWSDSNVRFYNGVSAYVTAYANVTYSSPFTESPLDGVTYQRSYGLLLSYVGGHWLVTRAAAATNGIVPS